MNYYDILIALLKQDSRFFTESGTLLRNAVYEAAMQMDAELIKLLLTDDVIKTQFFTDIDGVLVFDKVGFGWVINNRQFLPDSYTRYKNKIGLADEHGDLISQSGNVELVFPYKDCVLEGGQTTEEQKKSEIFYNEVLAPAEIDRMFLPKVFTNVRKYSTSGKTEKIDCFNYDSDNLIIKGNNLLALTSLTKRYENKIKCIYVDPPYYFRNNKSGDTFGYNSNFKLSSWLTFMKNRLSIARTLLHPDGSIWVSVGADGQHYLKVLMDEIFGDDCFVSDISWQKTYSPRNDSQGISGEVESILVYSKSPNWMPKKLPRTDKMNSVYKNPDNDYTLWRTSDAFAPSAATHQGMVYAIQHPVTGELLYPYNGACWPLEQNKMLEEMNKWAKYKFEQLNDDDRRASVCGVLTDSIRKNVPAIVLDESLDSAKEKALTIIKRGQWPKFFFTKQGYGGIARKTYLDDSKGKVVTNFWPFEEAGHTDEAKKEITAIFNEKVFSTPKPEKLLHQILYVATNENDIVLDFHLGSGTTCTVAHKMKRKYIGIEQMDYIESVSVNRLRYVLDNSDDDYNWQGGGSFIYCELAKSNQTFIDEITIATDAATLEDIYKRMLATGFISSKVNPKYIDASKSEFAELSLENQKQLLMELLDKNLLYVNYCDIDDEEFNISDEDKAFTRSFYGEV